MKDFVMGPIKPDEVRRRIRERKIKNLKIRKRIFIGLFYTYLLLNLACIIPLLHAAWVFIGQPDIDVLQYSINFTNFAIVLYFVCIDILILTSWAFATLLTGKEEL